MKRFLLSFGLLFTLLTVNAQDTLRGIVFSAIIDTTLQDSLETPSSARGVAGFLLQNDSLLFDITINGLSGEIMEAGIHSEEDSVLISLDNYIDRNSIRGIMPDVSLGDSLVMQMLSGNTYVVIHTEANPDGEVRGRLMTETDINYGTMLDAEQAGITDTLDTTPMGLSSYNLSMDSMVLEINILVNDLTSAITNAHLHYGAPGVSGPPVVPLMPYRNGDTFRGLVMLDSLDNAEEFLDSLNMGHVYVNVHTQNYPAGEIRGQLGRHDALAFDSWLNTEQVTDPLDPATPDSARGFMHMYINEAMDSLWVHVLVDSLSGPVMASHFHIGPPGVPGPVIVPLTDTVVGNVLMVELSTESPEFSDEADFYEFLSEALDGNIYINVHTELNPGGEIRGQVIPVVRPGVVFNLCSKQEVGTVNGGDKAQGSGFVSMDRSRRGLHYGMAVSELSSPLTGAHFHNGMPGVNGPVVHTLPTDSVVSGYWNDSTFTAEMAGLVENGSIYANFHTTMNPDGEVRGQVMINNLCAVPLGVNDRIAASYQVSIYPNPVQNSLSVSYQLMREADVEVRVYNLIGKEVSALLLGNKTAGSYTENLDASSLQNGMYIYSLYVNGTAVSNTKVIVNR